MNGFVSDKKTNHLPLGLLTIVLTYKSWQHRWELIGVSVKSFWECPSRVRSRVRVTCNAVPGRDQD